MPGIDWFRGSVLESLLAGVYPAERGETEMASKLVEKLEKQGAARKDIQAVKRTSR